MFRYIGLVWNETSPAQRGAVGRITARLAATSSDWIAACDTPGLRILIADAQRTNVQRLSNAGCIVGKLYERQDEGVGENPARSAQLDEVVQRRTVAARGLNLTREYWGDYVAFIREPASPICRVLKDPTGALPCFLTIYDGIAVAFSSIADCAMLNLFTFTINRAYLEDRLCCGIFRQRTALNEVEKVHGGECVTLDSRQEPIKLERRFYWSPLDYPDADAALSDPGAASQALRRALRFATHTLAASHDRVQVRLSGGLDSSIILGCLKDAPTRPKIVCYTYFIPNAKSSELHWAQLAAEHADCEHIAHAVGPHEVALARALDVAPTVEPVISLVHVQRVTVEAAITARTAATATFTGDGGDSGFGRESVVFTLTDFLRHRGLHPSLFWLAGRIALCTGNSSWMLLAHSLRAVFAGDSPPDREAQLREGSQLVMPEIRDRLRHGAAIDHPWLQHGRRLPSGFRDRLGALPFRGDYYGSDPSRSLAEEISPLYAQPVIETLLRIPLYVLFHNGVDRGLARRAFTDEVPRPILQRLWKDAVPNFMSELVRANRDFLREILLDGYLVAEQLLDRRAVEKALSHASTRSAVFPGELLLHLSTEIWARNWTEMARHRAAA